MTRIKSKKYTGVYYKEHPTRKHGVKKDKYITIRYQKDGKGVEEALGWASDGMTEEKAVKVLCDIKTNIKLANGEPTSLREKRELETKKRNENITFREWFLGGYTNSYLYEKKEKKKIPIKKVYTLEELIENYKELEKLEKEDEKNSENI